jgi:tRNA dimethylallyltransferase
MKVLVIVGPTASGKSALAVQLAKQFNGEVISADSRQVYAGLDIGTGKITKKEMQRVPHHILDVCSPKRAFSAGDFVRKARAAITDIGRRGKLPIIAGGTGFYIDALLGRIDLPDVPPNPVLRKELSKHTASELFLILKKKDPRRARAMNTPSERNNKVRLIRAIEIASAPKKLREPRSDLGIMAQQRAGSATRLKLEISDSILWIGISPASSVLDEKIHTRLLTRIKKGMVAEARQLHDRGLSYKRMRELGLEYRSLADFLEKKITKDEMIATLTSEIRRYARKQTGYWNRNSDIHRFDPSQINDIEEIVDNWLSQD